MTARTPDHPVDELFVNRWSPRAFDRSEMPEADLKTILEAARWAPSAFNIQPWRFVYARRGDAGWQTLVDLLNPFNKDWGQHASALVYLFSDTEVDGKDGKPGRPNGYHAFDAGSAWTHAALQATKLGYHAHGVAGIQKDEIHEKLGVPDRPDLLDADMRVLANHILNADISWMRALLAVRDRLTGLIGMKTTDKLALEQSDMPLDMRQVGDRVEFFKIYSISDNEIILGEDDWHQDFRVSVLRTNGRSPRVYASTCCKRHNLGGYAYLALILPFHKLIARSVLDKAVESRLVAA
eukprot:g1242.t1